jgi:cell division protein FtsL
MCGMKREKLMLVVVVVVVVVVVIIVVTKNRDTWQDPDVDENVRFLNF